MKMLLRWLFPCLLCLLCLPKAAWAEDDHLAQLREQLAQAMPGVVVDDIRMTPVAGLLELVSEGRIFYITQDARHVLYGGQLVDMETGVNLTQQRMGELSLAVLQELPADLTVEFSGKPGGLNRVMYVFTDHTCPYCRKLHQELPALQDAGVTVRYLLYPRAGYDSDAYDTLASVWCTDDPAEALNTVKNGGDIAIDSSCDHPVDAHIDLAQQMGLRGTPLMILDTGMRIPGYQSAAEILENF